MDKSNQGTIVGITFTSKDNPNTSYSIGTYVAGSESESERNIKANRILANYVLPSVRSLNRLNEFSTITMSKNLQYRILNVQLVQNRQIRTVYMDLNLIL